ncbi:MAG: dTDP-glucose 4,6-dehydratase [Planctomycetota bacterium]|jgi:dTDP-glucose 4,6-dehydratase|nr:dTDP-glucose 4,6-dehydratase [Planctomycetota bacterium]
MNILVTGGSGFIGSALCRLIARNSPHRVVNYDLLTYAANPLSTADLAGADNYVFVRGDIRDADALARVFARSRPDGVIHLAAESHVDRSIDGPRAFLDANVIGSYRLLQAAREYRDSGSAPENFRLVHVSTDEVFGSLGPEGKFSEATPYDPSSPYSASKAAADHLARAWRRTYGLPTIVTNCSNNYGPRQFPEKLVPLVILNAVEERPLPVYGDGMNVRDWLYVEDHARALLAVLESGRVGESYNIGGDGEMTNLELVRAVCAELDLRRPRRGGKRHAELIEFVRDRPGHDRRYAMDSRKIRRELGWAPRESFAAGIAKTVDWYLENGAWRAAIPAASYRARLGGAET